MAPSAVTAAGAAARTPVTAPSNRMEQCSLIHCTSASFHTAAVDLGPIIQLKSLDHRGFISHVSPDARIKNSGPLHDSGIKYESYRLPHASLDALSAQRHQSNLLTSLSFPTGPIIIPPASTLQGRRPPASHVRPRGIALVPEYWRWVSNAPEQAPPQNVLQRDRNSKSTGDYVDRCEHSRFYAPGLHVGNLGMLSWFPGGSKHLRLAEIYRFDVDPDF
ncbi:hypothetical protein B0H10DRAFT_1954508 [Mycena sp. CBHHK59/15]|nr:hypothetical protein B0H10DRAFT_1954508 [Mycena sp. CBHHK59/15]